MERGIRGWFKEYKEIKKESDKKYYELLDLSDNKFRDLINETIFFISFELTISIFN